MLAGQILSAQSLRAYFSVLSLSYAAAAMIVDPHDPAVQLAYAESPPAKPGIHYNADSHMAQKEPVALDEAAGKMTPAAGFKVSLVAGEPDVQQPIAMAFDDRGRLWVAECYSYPNWAATGHDRILIFEDTKGTGHYDKRTVFWDQGNYITGILPGFGGVWVCNSPNLIFIPFKEGEDKPSGPPQVMLDGWSNKGKHNVLNALLWGPDGWLYGCNGITAPSKVGVPGCEDKDRQPISCGVWRFHPTKKIFEVVCHGTTNPFGLDYDQYGQMFITNCVIAHLWQVIPGAHYQRMFGEDVNPHSYQLIEPTSDHLHWGGGNWTTSRGGQGLHSVAGGGHAHAGAVIYQGETWPDEYRNGIFTCNLHGNRINHDRLEKRGAGYVGRHAPDFLMANDQWFRGDFLLMGPDDCLYVADWNDTGECHSTGVINRETGRIYKVSYGDAKPPRPFDLNQRTELELVEMQLGKNDWNARHARRILQERAAAGRDMTKARERLLELSDSEDDVPINLRTLWSLFAVGGFDNALQERYLNGVVDQEVAVWVLKLAFDGRAAPAKLQKLIVDQRLHESGPRVRLELASVLQRMPLADRWPIAQQLVTHSEDAEDRNLPLMIWYGIEPAVAADRTQAIRLAESCKIPLVRRLIAKRLTDILGGNLDSLVDLLRATDNAALQLDVLVGMREELAGSKSQKMPRGWESMASKLANSGNVQVRTNVEVISMIFGSTAALASLKQKMMDAKLDAEPRQSALAVLVQQRVPDLAPLLQSLLAEQGLRAQAIRGLAAYDDSKSAGAIIDVYKQLDAAGKQDAIETLTSRKRFATEMVNAIAAGTIARTDVTAFTARQIRELKDPQLVKEFEAAWGTVKESSQDKQASIAKYKTALPSETLKQANLVNGRQIFSRTCQQCHTLYGVGGKVGPDLTGSNRANLDYILENIVDPSAVVAKEYKLRVFRMNDGRVISAIVKETRSNTLVLQTNAEQLLISNEDIESQKESPISMMPDGQLDRMTLDEVRDLIGYLATAMQVPLPSEKPHDHGD